MIWKPHSDSLLYLHQEASQIYQKRQWSSLLANLMPVEGKGGPVPNQVATKAALRLLMASSTTPVRRSTRREAEHRVAVSCTIRCWNSRLLCSSTITCVLKWGYCVTDRSLSWTRELPSSYTSLSGRNSSSHHLNICLPSSKCKSKGVLLNVSHC